MTGIKLLNLSISDCITTYTLEDVELIFFEIRKRWGVPPSIKIEIDKS